LPSVLGIPQSILAPYGMGFLRYTDQSQVNEDISSQNLVLRFQLHWRRRESYDHTKHLSASFAPREFVGVHPIQLLPVFRISRVDPQVPDLNVVVHVPYPLALLLGIALAVFRHRKKRKQLVGFPVTGRGSRDRSESLREI